VPHDEQVLSNTRQHQPGASGGVSAVPGSGAEAGDLVASHTRGGKAPRAQAAGATRQQEAMNRSTPGRWPGEVATPVVRTAIVSGRGSGLAAGSFGSTSGSLAGRGEKRPRQRVRRCAPSDDDSSNDDDGGIRCRRGGL